MRAYPAPALALGRLGGRARVLGLGVAFVVSHLLTGIVIVNRAIAFLALCAGVVTLGVTLTLHPANAAPQVIPLDEQARELRADFNAAVGSVRLLMIVDPACSVCLRGLDDVNAALLADLDDPRLQTFVVHTSVIGAEPKHVPPAASLLTNAHVRHYWDASGNFGRSVSESLHLRRGDDVVYAWDVWMIYDDQATLGASGVPAPSLFMHQLPKLRDQPDKPFLDAEAFAAKARTLLAALPPAANAAKVDR